MCLRFVFLLATRILAAARVSHRDAAWRTAEILLLQHQLAVLMNQAAPQRPLPDYVIDLEHFRTLRPDRIGRVLHEYHITA